MSYQYQQQGYSRADRQPTIELIGTNIGASLSPVMMNYGFRMLGLSPEQWWYGRHELPYIEDRGQRIEQLRDLLAQKLQDGCRGLAVTIPFKTDILKTGLVEPGHKQTLMTGAVNTLLPSGGKWLGYNTDCQGVRGAIESKGIDVSRGTTIVLGAGATATSTCVALAAMGAHRVLVTNHNLDKAQRLTTKMNQSQPSTRFDVEHWGTDERSELARECRVARLIINTTPAGQTGTAYERQDPLQGIELKSAALMDVVYDPLLTPFLHRGLEQGRPIIPGIVMLAHVAAAQLALFTGADREELNLEIATQQMLGAGFQERLHRAHPNVTAN